MENLRVSGQGYCVRRGRLWQLAILATAGTLGIASRTEATTYYWQDSAPAVEQPAPTSPTKRAKGFHAGDKKLHSVVAKESKPQGPLIISISIAQQRLRIYDANGLFAESPVSTGMPGHSTPMGVFSVIQKQKFHQSNIYSGAPMPFMQRITWSGIAMHAGVLPGHPASHGCIRLPMAFAVKMYGWTRMGARVIVTPGDVTPASFSHPLLASAKVVAQPAAAAETKADVATVNVPEQPAGAAAEGTIELRSSVGHVDGGGSASDNSGNAAPLQVKTADASGALPTALARDPAPQPSETTVSDLGETAKTAMGADADVAKPADDAVRPVETAADQPTKPDGALTSGKASKTSDPPTASAAGAASAESSKTNAETEKPPAVQAAPAAPPAPASADETVKGDPKSDVAKMTGAKVDPAPSFKNTGQISVFVSRKDSKLYIRQNFAPLYEIPVTIAADARPLGTHIFTAQVDGQDSNTLHWSVVSLPAPAKVAERRVEQRSAHGLKAARPQADAKPQQPVPDSPAEALDRLSLPAGVMAKIYEAVSTGGSIIVSDQGIAAGETGEGTDFIVSLR
jgi:lipoprotein-anchoring transpeptidase ErfK/SrfK